MFIDTPGGRLFGGREVVERIADLTLGVLPSWLEVDQGTPAFTEPPAGRGHVNVATAASVSSVAQLRTTQTFDLNHYKAIGFCVEGLSVSTYSSGQVDVGMHLSPDSGNNAGGAAVHLNAAEKAVLRTHTAAGGNSDSDALDEMRGTWRRSYTLLLTSTSRSLYFLRGTPLDGKVAALRENVSSMPLGVIRPRVRIVTTTGTARSFSVRQLRLLLVSN